MGIVPLRGGGRCLTVGDLADELAKYPPNRLLRMLKAPGVLIGVRGLQDVAGRVVLMPDLGALDG